MAKRRPSGDGMVRKREDGRWEGRIVVGHKENGDSIFRYVYADTQKELTAKLRQNIDAYQGVDLTEQSRMTLGEWLDQWLESMASMVRPTTLARCESAIRNHIKPFLGEKPVSHITEKDVRKFCDHLSCQGNRITGKGLSSGSIRSIISTLHQAVEAAQQANMIPKSAVEGIKLPKASHRPMQVLTDDQLEKFMKIIQEDAVWYDFFYTELTTGLRRGEICGLKWEDFDEAEGTLKVNRSVSTRKAGSLEVGETKTNKGHRSISLPDSTAQRLRERKKTAISDWIFPNPLHPEEAVNPGYAYNRMKTILKNTGLPSIRFHDLRHTFATHALAGGVDAKTLSGILGHTNASFTLDTYTHVTGDMQKQAANTVCDFMTDLLGEEWKPWQENERTAKEL